MSLGSFFTYLVQGNFSYDEHCLLVNFRFVGVHVRLAISESGNSRKSSCRVHTKLCTSNMNRNKHTKYAINTNRHRFVLAEGVQHEGRAHNETQQLRSFTAEYFLPISMIFWGMWIVARDGDLDADFICRAQCLTNEDYWRFLSKGHQQPLNYKTPQHCSWAYLLNKELQP